MRRIAQMVPVLLLVSLIVFSLLHLIPGDPALAMLGDQATPQAVAALHAKLGLDQPLPVQYFHWLGALVRGDLGRSIGSNQPVSEAIAQHLPVTLELAILSVAISLLIAIPAGIIAATKRNSRLDAMLTSFSMLGISLPHFFMAILLIFVFALHLRWLPPLGFKPILDDPADNLRRMIMPAITLGTGLSAIVMRMTRSSLLEVLEKDYIRTARAKGLSEMKTIRRHALKNALIPVVTIVGLQIGALLGGTIITETIFALPGIGRLLIDAIFQRDYPLVQGVVLFAALAFLLTNLLVDLEYAYLDPRIRYS
jgi:peptide/nickel transport system permease protein